MSEYEKRAMDEKQILEQIAELLEKNGWKDTSCYTWFRDKKTSIRLFFCKEYEVKNLKEKRKAKKIERQYKNLLTF